MHLEDSFMCDGDIVAWMGWSAQKSRRFDEVTSSGGPLLEMFSDKKGNLFRLRSIFEKGKWKKDRKGTLSPFQMMTQPNFVVK
jgi:hypothetical protein